MIFLSSTFIDHLLYFELICVKYLLLFDGFWNDWIDLKLCLALVFAQIIGRARPRGLVDEKIQRPGICFIGQFHDSCTTQRSIFRM